MVLTTSRCHQHAASTDVRPNKLAEKAEACRSLDTFCRSDARVAVVAFRRCRFAVHRLPLRSLLSFLILLRLCCRVLVEIPLAESNDWTFDFFSFLEGSCLVICKRYILWECVWCMYILLHMACVLLLIFCRTVTLLHETLILRILVRDKRINGAQAQREIAISRQLSREGFH